MGPRSKNWWARQDSNPRPSRYERPALTAELQAHARPRLQTGGGTPLARPAPLGKLDRRHDFTNRCRMNPVLAQTGKNNPPPVV